MALGLDGVAQLAVASGLIVLAATLFALDLGGRRQRALALLLFLQGAIIGCSQAIRIHPEAIGFWSGVRGYLIVGEWFAFADFLLLYTLRRPSTWRRWLRGLSFVGLILAEATYASNHATLFVLQDDGSIGRGSALGLLANSIFTAYGGAGVWFAFRARRSSEASAARFQALLSVAFSLSATIEGSFVWFILADTGWQALVVIDGPLLTFSYLASLPLGLTAFAVILWFAGSHPSPKVWWVWTGCLLTAGLVLPAVGFFADASQDAVIFLAALAVARLIPPAVLSYALLRQNPAGVNPLDLDHGVRTTLRRGTIGAILVAVFFVASEGASQAIEAAAMTNAIGPGWAQLIGILGAGLLLLALAPLQHIGDRVSGSVLPEPSSMKNDERARLFLQQAEIAWQDGSLTRKERLLLDSLREKLRLPLETAAQLEARASHR